LYVAKFTPDAVEEVRALPKNIRNALKREFKKTLLVEPVGCSVTLQEPLAGFRSFHFGGYRVVFRVYEDLKLIAVVGVGRKSSLPHSDIYRRLEKLAETGKLADSVLTTIRRLSGS
jgi:mRNA-degrading endonuclease RelE of RelBE toxin-antitoxin system